MYVMQGYLMKKGRENNQFLPRKFVLSEIDNTIKYYVKVEVTFEPVLLVSSQFFRLVLVTGQEGPKSSDQDLRHQCCLQSQ